MFHHSSVHGTCFRPKHLFVHSFQSAGSVGSMTEMFKVFTFGDETGSFAEPLQKLCERRTGVLFLHFLAELKKVLREEVHRQARHVRDQIPEFTDILNLVKRYRESASRNQILETTFTCVCQLASVIRYVSRSCVRR